MAKKLWSITCNCVIFYQFFLDGNCISNINNSITTKQNALFLPIISVVHSDFLNRSIFSEPSPNIIFAHGILNLANVNYLSLFLQDYSTSYMSDSSCLCLETNLRWGMGIMGCRSRVFSNFKANILDKLSKDPTILVGVFLIFKSLYYI